MNRPAFDDLHTRARAIAEHARRQRQALPGTGITHDLLDRLWRDIAHAADILTGDTT